MHCLNDMKPVKSDEDWLTVNKQIRRVFNIS